MDGGRAQERENDKNGNFVRKGKKSGMRKPDGKKEKFFLASLALFGNKKGHAVLTSSDFRRNQERSTCEEGYSCGWVAKSVCRELWRRCVCCNRLELKRLKFRGEITGEP